MRRGTTGAETCRLNGWTAGTHLVGDEGCGPTVIRLTAIGEDAILARAVSHNGQPTDRRETTWTLDCREWQEWEP